MARSTDVVIIGAGAIGGAVALALSGRGLTVTVVESGRIGRGASWASAGVLAPEWGQHDPPALTRLATDSLALWPDWAAEVEARSGVGLNVRKDGLLNLWVDPETPERPRELALEAPPLGPSGQRLTADEVRRLEPVLSGPIAGAVFDPEVYQVDNPRLAPALARAAHERGARFQVGAPVVGLSRSNGRCHGVIVADGSTIEAGAVVLAAGAWSGPLSMAMGVRLPVEPWRGQMLRVDAESRPLRHVVFCGELVLVPRPHGPLVVGTTLEKVGFDSRVTLGGLCHILARADRMAPGLGGLPVAHTWAGLRPDGLPYLGPVPGCDGLFAATGHGRKGIILAPITGEVLARLIVDGALDPRIEGCLPARAVE